MSGSNMKRPLEPTETRKTRIQLMLHCVDGCVPYLNPYQLEQHFPPSVTNLWLGLAVRDSCIRPIFNSPNDSVKTDAEEMKNHLRTTKNKVHGYTFAATSPDPWLLPYTRITASSFDVKCLDQYDTNTNKTTKRNSKRSNSRNTNKSVHVWTPHGRQKLTADMYFTASLEGLKSQHTISLFDYVDEGEFSTTRKLKAERRNQEWFQHLSSRHHSFVFNQGLNGHRGSLLWKPVLLPHINEKEFGHNHQGANPSTSSLPKDFNVRKDIEHVPSGIAFVGRWRPGLQLDKIIYKDSSVKDHFDNIRWKSILSTYTLSEILDIASTGIINVIGTNLPQKWAKEKLALGLDLSMEFFLHNSATQRDRKRQKMDTIEKRSTKEIVTITKKTLLNTDGCMDLSNKVHARDPNPLVIGCQCFVCKENRFSRAYIHHLVVAKEMLAEILIFGHNLHCLLKLLRCFDSERSNQDKVRDFIRRQLCHKEDGQS